MLCSHFVLYVYKKVFLNLNTMYFINKICNDQYYCLFVLIYLYNREHSQLKKSDSYDDFIIGIGFKFENRFL